MSKFKSAIDQVRKGSVNPSEVSLVAMDILGVSLLAWFMAVMFSRVRTVDFENVILNGFTAVVFHLSALFAAVALCLGLFLLFYAAMAWVIGPLKKKDNK